MNGISSSLLMEYPRKYDIIFHLGLPQEYAYSYSPRRVAILLRNIRPSSDPPFSRHIPYNIVHCNIVLSVWVNSATSKRPKKAKDTHKKRTNFNRYLVALRAQKNKPPRPSGLQAAMQRWSQSDIAGGGGSPYAAEQQKEVRHSKLLTHIYIYIYVYIYIYI